MSAEQMAASTMDRVIVSSKLIRYSGSFFDWSVTDTVIQLKQIEPNKFVATEVSQFAAKPDAKFDLGLPINFSEGPFVVSRHVYSFIIMANVAANR